MTSLTTITKRRRAIKKRSMGKERKRRARNLGTTPPFAIHPEDETEEMKVKREKIMKLKE